MSIIKYRLVAYIFSGGLVLASLVGLALWQLKPGIEFTGGSLMSVTYTQVQPPVAAVEKALEPFDIKPIVQPIGDRGVLIRATEIPEAKHQEILVALGEIFKNQRESETVKAAIEAVIPAEEQAAFYEIAGADVLTEDRFEAVGPAIGQELQSKSVFALALVLLMIVVYVSWAFRKSGGLVRPWQYGVVTLVTLFHDVIITVGVFAYLGHFMGIEVNAAFIAAILTILGYSVNDTVVVFDRIRENIRRSAEKDFGKVVGQSLRQTFARSLNTSLTVFFVLLAIFLFGGASLQAFIGALLIGVAVGSYSTLFIASPILVDIAKRQ